MPIIYKIINSVNSKVYVGQTRHKPRIRWTAHVRHSRIGKDTPLYRAMRLHGTSSFSMEVIETVDDPKKLDAREIFWITELKTHGSLGGYNATWGGNGGYHKEDAKTRMKGRKHSPETIAKMSALKKGMAPTPNMLAYYASKRGKPARFIPGNLPPERRDLWRARMAAAWTPERTAQFAKAQSAAKKGIPRGPLSEETKTKMRGRIVSEETRAKLRDHMLNLSPEVKAKRDAAVAESTRKRMSKKTPEERSALARMAQRASIGRRWPVKSMEVKGGERRQQP